MMQEERLATWILLSELAMFGQEKKFTTVNASKKLSDSFLKSGRLDAEYYQPKYDYLFNELERFKTKTLGQIATLYKSMSREVMLTKIQEYHSSEWQTFLNLVCPIPPFV